MVIKFFTLTLLCFSIIAYFVPVEDTKKNSMYKDIPLVVFEKPVMYTLTNKSVNRVVVANNAVKYENRDEMFDADIILKNSDSSQKYKNEKLKADTIVKKGDIYTLTNNVNYQRDNIIKLDTDELIYDEIKKTAKNFKPFKGIYNNHIFNGTTFFLDINEDYITSKDTHFEIDVSKK